MPGGERILSPECHVAVQDLTLFLGKLLNGKLEDCLMDKLAQFIESEREVYEHNNMFALGLGQADRYYRFLHRVYARYLDLSPRVVDNVKRSMDIAKEQGNGPVGPELWESQMQGRELGEQLQLEIESFYLFGTIFLDRVACFIEGYFQKPSEGRIDTHRKLKNKLREFVVEKGLALPEGFEASVDYLENDLAEFRDKDITHDKSPRTIRGITWDSDGVTGIHKSRVYPREGDPLASGTPPPNLMNAIEIYVENYARKLVTVISGGVFDLLDPVLERHSFDDVGEMA